MSIHRELTALPCHLGTGISQSVKNTAWCSLRLSSLTERPTSSHSCSIHKPYPTLPSLSIWKGLFSKRGPGSGYDFIFKIGHKKCLSHNFLYFYYTIINQWKRLIQLQQSSSEVVICTPFAWMKQCWRNWTRNSVWVKSMCVCVHTNNVHHMYSKLSGILIIHI